MKLMSHQEKARKQLLPILQEHGVAYLAGELRTGKTITALYTADSYLDEQHDVTGFRPKVLFITSKGALEGIHKDYENYEHFLGINLQTTNFESTHKIDYRPDFLIIDEAHRIGAYPKAGLITRTIRAKFGNLPTILMSGTPSPESYSQLFHQFWVTMQGIWKDYVGFYKWAHAYVDIERVFIGMGRITNNYSKAKPIVLEEFKKLCVTMTQKDAGFNGVIVEKVHTIPLPDYLKLAINKLRKQRVFDDAWIGLIADTAARLSSMVHQLSSGTIISNEGKAFTVDDYKAQYIKKEFKGQHIAIFYIFQEEGVMLKKIFPHWTDSPSTFNTNKSIVYIRQVQSGREGVNLSTADALIFFNISYSAVSYWQARARSQSFKGGDKMVHWIFSDVGVEQAVYQAVKDKQDFTLKHFQAYDRNTDSGTDNKTTQKGKIRGHQVEGNGQGRLARYIGTGRPSGDTVDRSKEAKRKDKSVAKDKGTMANTKRISGAAGRK